MNKQFHRLVFIMLVFVAALAFTARIAVAKEEIAQQGILFAITRVFEQIHWLFFGLVVITCYYFRYIIERNIFGNPPACSIQGGMMYKGDRLIYQFHRYFLWISLVFIAAYLAASAITLPVLLSSMNLNTLQITTKFLEFFVGITFLLYLFGCYHIKYLFERLLEQEPKPCSGCWRNTLSEKQSLLNSLHGHFFWISVAGVIILHTLFIFGGHVG